jgi:hypothetical protein
MPSVKALRMIGAFLDFLLWSFFDPCFLNLLWYLGVLVLGFFASLLQTDTPLP